ncbi:hypothetical protein EMIHUDRAFT_236301 [Emiliania huxleyi CCMP1516]|uniref:Uncharacterized protein n=2 Tax=Emiliania huxleyi TaxID=2903 RepID=A0A0D3JTQ3_EMIH1|nr:hypothetical protein EMIHUDRAFT_236301 [Emiliania huxleyi CCMP1516]EOD26888.1 hypothetical protein EMIHUDRAFT_236301 [Emiliania huxleyi CCMP1516]|eukprot:XP_005779317.1 hypothetical protein EMIHUDRAFT_236301 [Emiliania huxleyi CCMP1516]
MSYRELRNFKEIMCTLGYPRLISIENFRKPHFELVADVLIWLCRRYDKKMQILDEIRTEGDRIAFLKSAAEQLLARVQCVIPHWPAAQVRARVKLNLKNLYQANGFAVKELLKVAALLHQAHRGATDDDEQNELSFDLGPGHAFADLKTTRAISADITKYGAALHEALEGHADAKEAAARALGKHHDADSMHKQLARRSRHNVRRNSPAVPDAHLFVQRLAEASAEEAESWADKHAFASLTPIIRSRLIPGLCLKAKIDKKRTELDRQLKRLASLQSADLNAQYSSYVSLWRNLTYLEGEGACTSATALQLPT